MIYTLPSGKQVRIETSWDDGCRDDLRLHQLLLEYGLPGTFYIPSVARELTDDEVLSIAKTREIGGHSETHRVLRLMSLADAKTEIEGCKFDLELLIKKPIKSFCYPKGKYSPDNERQVADAGYVEARTVDVLTTFLPEQYNRFRKPTTVHAWRRREYSGTPWHNIAVGLFDRVMDPDTMDNYFHLWGHGWEIEKMHHWQKLESFFLHMREALNNTTINVLDLTMQQSHSQTDFRI